MPEPNSISKKELSEERKKRKIAKRKAKRQARLISFFTKAACGLLAVVLLCLGAVACVHQAAPAVTEEDTFPYTGKCVDAYKRIFPRTHGRTTTKIEVHFEDGNWYRWSENAFSDAEIESMIGSNLVLTMGKRMDGTEFPVEVRHENGYVYRTLEEYNADQAELCRNVLKIVALSSGFLYILILPSIYLYKPKSYKH